MARGKLFEFAILYHPRKKEKEEETKKSVILSEPKTVLASNEQEVGILAARSLPEEYLDKLDDIEIIVRPF